MEKNIKINIPEGYNDAVFDKETNEIKFIKCPKLGDKVTIDGVEGYVLEVDDAGEPTVLCSEFLGEMSWDNAMKKSNQGPWHLPTVEEFRKYYKLVRELDGIWYCYWTSTEYNSLVARYVNTSYGDVYNNAKANSYYVRAFAFVGSKKTKIGSKITIDGVEGYVLEVDDAGEPTVLCSEILGDLTWDDAMEKVNQGLWHLPSVDEFKKYYKIIREFDCDWHVYWTSTENNPLYACYVSTGNGVVGNFYIKTTTFYVRAFAYVGSKKDSKPRSWKEYCEQVKNTSCFAIDIASMGGAVTKRSREKIPFANEVNTIEEAKAVVALCKLIQLRDAWWGEWKPDWDSTNDKFVISSESNKICKSVLYYSNRCLAFPTPEMRDEFLESFRDLIEEAKPLL